MSTDTRIALADFDLVPVPSCGTRTLICLQRNGVGDDKCMCRYGTRTLSLRRRRRCLCRYGTVGYDTVRYRSLVNVHNDSTRTRTVRVRKCDDR